MKLAERLRRVIIENKFDIETKKIKISASFGVAGFGPNNRDGEISFDILIKDADKYLCQAKNEGRNRVAGGRLET